MNIRRFESDSSPTAIDVDHILSLSAKKHDDVGIEALENAAWLGEKKKGEFYVPFIRKDGQIRFAVYEFEDLVLSTEGTQVANELFLNELIQLMFQKGQKGIVISHLKEILIDGKKEFTVRYSLYTEQPDSSYSGPVDKPVSPLSPSSEREVKISYLPDVGRVVRDVMKFHREDSLLDKNRKK